MSEESYQLQFEVTAPVEKAYQAILEQVNQWWSSEASATYHAGDVLMVPFGETDFMKMEVTKAQPHHQINWKVLDANNGSQEYSLREEWTSTEMFWKIEASENGSHITFRHQGLVPSFGCYKVCENGWNTYLKSLQDLLNKGVGNPFMA